MKEALRRISFFSVVLLLIGSGACAQKNEKAGGPVSLETEMDSVSYIMGASLGSNIRREQIEDVDLEALLKGVKDGLESDSALLISRGKSDAYIASFIQKHRKEVAEAQMARANQFMEEQEATGEYEKTESGMLYKVIEQGDGEVPTSTSEVKVHYEGTNMEGEIFDSSYQRGKPSEFPANRVIRGWTEALTMMPVGSTYKVVIPPDLAYGERGSPPKIGPNEPLTFKIELLDIIVRE